MGSVLIRPATFERGPNDSTCYSVDLHELDQKPDSFGIEATFHTGNIIEREKVEVGSCDREVIGKARCGLSTLLLFSSLQISII